MTDHRPLNILMLSAEVAPLAKVGGLADVVGSLPQAIQARGHDVRVAMPRYRLIDPQKHDLSLAAGPFPVPMHDRSEPASVLQGALGSVPVYLINNAHYFDRDNIYMYPDDAERFIFFTRSALEMLKVIEWRPDIIHCHDWHTALVPNWMKTVYKNDPFFAETVTVYTIHNLAYQGIFDQEVLDIAGLPHATSCVEEPVNFMARGIRFADMITTVSERYAQEILTPHFGEGMELMLQERRDRIRGILNGIDHSLFDPLTDPHITARYDADNLERRVDNKLALQREAGLPEDPGVPLLATIGRLAGQKGYDLLAQMIRPMLDVLSVQFVLLGTGEQHYHDVFEQVGRERPRQAAAFLRFDPAMAQRIYAGSDMFLMPSRFEPCGLGQMIAMRYGSVPIVRFVGGLADTVTDFDPTTGEGLGFVFDAYDPWALFAAVVRGVECYRHRQAWRELQRRCMEADFSWEASAAKYQAMYYETLRIRAGEEGRIG